ncbi:MAG: hypothetical protein D6778_09245 [Nitrospirae bacterium]|nr:MAG: hypothetical protein D6778_09245 [Nitrospirota bacterium]
MFMVTVLALKGLFLSLPLVLASLVYSGGLIRTFLRHKGMLWSIAGCLYWLFIYPIPVTLGGITGALKALVWRQNPISFEGGKSCSGI